MLVAAVHAPPCWAGRNMSADAFRKPHVLKGFGFRNPAAKCPQYCPKYVRDRVNCWVPGSGLMVNHGRKTEV
jgi:hypothetical protein